MSGDTTPDLFDTSGAEIVGAYRYRLWRSWGSGERVVWCMLNPSNADAERDDPTIRRCCGFARAWGYDGIEVVNIFAYRATDPRELLRVPDPVGPGNAHVIAGAVAEREVVCAWGAGVHWFTPDVYRLALETVAHGAGSLVCLGTTMGGYPRHPLYLGMRTERRRFTPRLPR